MRLDSSVHDSKELKLSFGEEQPAGALDLLQDYAILLPAFRSCMLAWEGHGC